jgi:hypothetical protein
MNLGIDSLNKIFCSSIIEAVQQSVPKKGGIHKKKIIPWWTIECDQAIKSRNKAFKILKRNQNFQNLIEYKKMQAIVKRVIRNTKREYWRNYCNSLGRETDIGKVWKMIKRMNGIKRDYSYPVLVSDRTTAVINEEKATMLSQTFVQIHSSNNISEE